MGTQQGMGGVGMVNGTTFHEGEELVVSGENRTLVTVGLQLAAELFRRDPIGFVEILQKYGSQLKPILDGLRLFLEDHSHLDKARLLQLMDGEGDPIRMAVRTELGELLLDQLRLLMIKSHRPEEAVESIAQKIDEIMSGEQITPSAFAGVWQGGVVGKDGNPKLVVGGVVPQSSTPRAVRVERTDETDDDIIVTVDDAAIPPLRVGGECSVTVNGVEVTPPPKVQAQKPVHRARRVAFTVIGSLVAAAATLELFVYILK